MMGSLAHIALGATLEQATAALGEPLEPVDLQRIGAPGVSDYFPLDRRLHVSIRDGHVVAVTLTGNGQSGGEPVAVGDSEARLHAAYGAALRPAASTFETAAFEVADGDELLRFGVRDAVTSVGRELKGALR